MVEYNGYHERLTRWVDGLDGLPSFTLESVDNDAAVFVTLRRESGESWTGSATYATPNPDAANAETARDLAALSAARLFQARRR